MKNVFKQFRILKLPFVENENLFQLAEISVIYKKKLFLFASKISEFLSPRQMVLFCFIFNNRKAKIIVQILIA